MRLYLSSFRLGRHPDRLVQLVRRDTASPVVAVIANALDGADPARREQAVEEELSALRGLDLAAQEVNLLDYRSDGDDLARDLAGYAALWVRGGNVFTLREALHLSGASVVVPRLLGADALVYSGYSAAGCVLAPDLTGLEECDDPLEVVRIHGTAARYDGLSVLDRALVPHLDSPDHPESRLLTGVAERYRRAGVSFWALRDGEELVVDGTVADAVVLP